MNTVVLKFGGSSVADNTSLNIVAKKIKKFYEKKSKIVVIVSAQGKTTDNLIKDALSLSNNPVNRELDVLLSTGEQMTMSKLAILLNSLNMPAISLTGWQAGIFTNDKNQNATILDIDTSRIEKELNEDKIVIIAGFQGINKNEDITTLGRGGSDTTAVAVAAALKADKCYIFSDVDGIYTTDPNKISEAKKLEEISYEEMLESSNEGAKVLHNKCVEIGKKYNVPIIAKTTFQDRKGTEVNNNKEYGIVKNIVKKEISKVAIIGNHIIENSEILIRMIKIIQESKIEIYNIEISENKIVILFKNIISEEIIEKLHSQLI